MKHTHEDGTPFTKEEFLQKLKTGFEKKWSEEDKLINDNIKNGKKIISYDKETFLPIFE